MGTSESEVRRANARRAVGSHLNVQWSDLQAIEAEKAYGSQKEAFQDFLDQSKGVATGSPNLVFVFSDEEEAPPSKARYAKPEPTRQAKDSAAAWAELFQTEGDYSVFIPGRFFNVYRVDATKMPESKNKYLCSSKAPMVILTGKDGKIVDVFEGRAAIKRNKIVDEMASILTKDGYIKSASSFAKLHQLMVSLEKIELETVQAKDRASDAAGKFAKAKSSKAAQKKGDLLASGKAAKENLDRAEDGVKDVQKQKTAILKEEYALLKDLGLPAAKMPPEPKTN